jgi:hypothetical protein
VVTLRAQVAHLARLLEQSEGLRRLDPTGVMQLHVMQAHQHQHQQRLHFQGHHPAGGGWVPSPSHGDAAEPTQPALLLAAGKPSLQQKNSQTDSIQQPLRPVSRLEAATSGGSDCGADNHTRTHHHRHDTQGSRGGGGSQDSATTAQEARGGNGGSNGSHGGSHGGSNGGGGGSAADPGCCEAWVPSAPDASEHSSHSRDTGSARPM